MEQASLFDDDEASAPAAKALGPLPPGLVYEPDFLEPAEEAALLEVVRSLPLVEATYKEWTARRRVAAYGGRFDYTRNRLLDAPPMPPDLHGLRDRVAAWAGVEAERLSHALVAEYRPGTPLGWHRDVPEFDEVFGVSLGGHATLRLRPYRPTGGRRGTAISLPLSPRSVYLLRGAARWDWQHSVPPVPAQRWSITFRTRRTSRDG